MNLEEIVYSLPSTKAFGDNIARRVRDQLVIVVVPNNLSREMVGRLIRNRLNLMADFSFRELSNPGQREPLDASAEAMNVSWPERTRRNTRNLLGLPDLPHLLFIHRVGTTGDQWAEFIKDWAQERHSLRGSRQAGIPSMCVIAKLRDFESGLPDPVPGLTYSWWWGFPSALEIKLACGIASVQNGDTQDIAKWRQFVLPSLVSNDVQLAETMWQKVLEDKSKIFGGLVEYWESLEEQAPDDEINDIIDFIKGEQRTAFAIGQEVPARLQAVWAGGGLVYTPEYGLEPHPALLAHTNHTVEVQKMVWRGQAELLLPFVNEVRLKICSELTDTYGKDWPNQWGPPTSQHELEQVKITPLAAELGYLHTLFSIADEKRLPIASNSELSRLVRVAREIRNKVAHNQPVACKDFLDLEAALDKANL